MKRVFCLLIFVALSLGMMPLNARATTTISHVSVVGLDYPTAGHTPDQLVDAAGQGHSANDIEWYDEGLKTILPNHEYFAAGHIYTAVIWLEAGDGYTFQCKNDYTTDVTATIDGVETRVYKVCEYKAWAMGTEYHWRTCKTCRIEPDETRMLHEDLNKDGKCETCGYVIGSGDISREIMPEPEETTEPGEGYDPDLPRVWRKRPQPGCRSRSLAWMVPAQLQPSQPF